MAQHLRHRPLDHLVLERWHSNRPLPATRFRYVHASDRLRPVTPAVHPIAQFPQPLLQILLVALNRFTIHPGSRLPLHPPEGALQRGHVDMM